MKLSKKQMDVLEEAVVRGRTEAVRWYPPIKKLLELGFIRAYDEGPNSFDNKWVPTDAGCGFYSKSRMG